MDEQNFNRQCNKGIILFVLFWIGFLHILINDYLIETMPLIVDIAIYSWASLGIVWGGAILITTMKIGCVEDFLESIDMFLRILSWVTIIVYCLNIASTIYLILVMRMIETAVNVITVRTLQSFSDNILIAVTVGGVMAMIFANSFRYAQAKEWGIPFKMTYHSLYDSVDVLGSVLLLVGLNMGLPLFIAFRDLQTTFAYLSLFGLFFIASLIMYWFIKTSKPSKILPFVIGVVGVTGLALYSLLANFRESIMLNNIHWTVLMIGLILHGTAVLALSCAVLWCRIYDQGSVIQKNINPMTVRIDGKTYLVAMRYSAEKWILIPCEVTGNYSTALTLWYDKGTFTIRDMSGLEVKQISYKDVKPLHTRSL